MLRDLPQPSRLTPRTSQLPGKRKKKLFPVVKQSGPVVVSAAPPSAEVQERVELYFHTSHHAFRACCRMKFTYAEYVRVVVPKFGLPGGGGGGGAKNKEKI